LAAGRYLGRRGGRKRGKRGGQAKQAQEVAAKRHGDRVSRDGWQGSMRFTHDTARGERACAIASCTATAGRRSMVCELQWACLVLQACRPCARKARRPIVVTSTKPGLACLSD